MRPFIAILGSVLTAHLVGAMVIGVFQQGLIGLLATPILLAFSIPLVTLSLPAALLQYALLVMVLDRRREPERTLGLTRTVGFALFASALGALLATFAMTGFAEDNPLRPTLVTGALSGCAACLFQIYATTCGQGDRNSTHPVM